MIATFDEVVVQTESAIELTTIRMKFTRARNMVFVQSTLMQFILFRLLCCYAQDIRLAQSAVMGRYGMVRGSVILLVIIPALMAIVIQTPNTKINCTSGITR